MPVPVLTTKIHVPALCPHLISRPHLLQQLDIGITRKLTLISAPAGFGKTTLLSAWTAARPHPVAWLSLDAGDNDIDRFYQHFAAALDSLPPLKDLHLGETGLGAFSSNRAPKKELLITSLINDIVHRTLHFVVVLDDFHVISALQVKEMLKFLIDNLPANMHLIISSREDPSWSLARLRVAGQLVELRADDLRFSLEEVKTFLNQVMGLGLSLEDLTALDSRTEGWAAGLKMAALSMQGRRDKSAFVRSFSGSHRFVLDYLMEEVLKQQPSDLQTFLLKTSILERLTASLCDAVTGREDGRQVLAQLDKANLFLIPLDDEREWYRYHHLFADLLRQRLLQNNALSVKELHHRASAWFEAQGFIRDAIAHALKAKNYEHVAAKLEAMGWELFTRGEISTVAAWIDALPEELLSVYPQLVILRAWVMAKSGQLDDVESILERITSENMCGEKAGLRAYVAGVRGDMSRTVDLARIALKHLPEDALNVRAIVTQNLGVAYYWQGNPISAVQTLRKAADLTRAADQTFQTLTTLAILGRALEMQGELRQAFDIYQEAIRLASEASQQPVPFASMVYVGLASVLYAWNDLEEAFQKVHEGIRLSQMGGFTVYEVFGYALLTRLCLAKGDEDQADHALRKAESLGQGSVYDLVMALVAEARVMKALRAGNLRALDDWIASHPIRSRADLDAAGEIEQIVVARVLMAQGKYNKALTLVRVLLGAAQEARRMESVLQCWIIEALILDAQHHTAKALSVLKEALSFAEPQGYRRVFLDYGSPMAKLLQEAVKQGKAAHAAARVLAHIEDQPVSSQVLVDPLSPREVDVLRLIVAGLSNQAIAEELVIAESTVKTHINHIYGKLTVTSRTQAAAKARELGLLS